MSDERGVSTAQDSSFIAPRSSFALIVTADDFGIGRRTSEGIIKAHLHGPVTATSLMSMTGDHVRASVPLLADAPNLDVGLHLVLTNCGEKPLMARYSSGLIGRDGLFHPNGKLWIKALTGKLQRAGIADEIVAQAEMFHKLVGRPPAYVDCHHHAHQLPIVRDALLDIIALGLLPPITRVTVEPPGLIRRVGSVRLKRTAAQWMGRRAAKAFDAKWIWTNDRYFGMLAPRDLRRAFPWAKYLAKLPQSGVVEWVVHPGEADDTLHGRDGYRTERVKELEALTSADGNRSWQHLRPFLSRKSILHRKPVEA
ncbi:MAG TPA: ChbG/HpnK family deacetylase [Tepidisphaeraceae bacterium]|nr:ChbG/HpnK family deacetylase [Tepidisphaeraceae bacterium]